MPSDYQNIYEQELAENRSYYVAIARAILRSPSDAEDTVSDYTAKVIGWRDVPGKADTYLAEGPEERSVRAFLATGVKRLALNKLRQRNRLGYAPPTLSEDDPDPMANLADPKSLKDAVEIGAEYARHLIEEAEDCFSKIAAAGMKRAIEVLRALVAVARLDDGEHPSMDAISVHLGSSRASDAKAPSPSTLRVQLLQARRALVECMATKGLNPQF